MRLVRFLLVRDGRVRTRRWSRQRLSNTAQIDDDSFDTVAFAFDLGLKALHLVAIEGVGNILTWEISKRRTGPGKGGLLTRRMLRVAMVAAKLENF